MKKNGIITVQDIPVTITQTEIEDYICITDIAAAKSDDYRAADVIKNWMRNRNTLEFLGTWESIYNPNFKVVEFDHFKQQENHVHPLVDWNMTEADCLKYCYDRGYDWVDFMNTSSAYLVGVVLCNHWKNYEA